MEALSPVFISILVGYVVGKTLNLDPKTLANSSLYIFTPALVFTSLSQADIKPADLAGIIVVMSLVFFSLWVVGLGLCRLLKIDIETKGAYLLSSLFPNSGNYGLPIVLFAYGQRGFERGVLCLMVSVLIINSFGVYIASRGDVDSTKTALKNILLMPSIYAFILALSLYLMKVTPPDIILRTVSLLGDATVPTELILLGLQLSRASTIIPSYKLIISAIGIKLLIAPVIAVILVFLIFGYPFDVTGKVLVVMAGTPSAVAANTMAVKFNSKPELVSSATFVTTVLSLITVKLILAFLG
ncbi:AEC family transporter [Paradesulfitobacterium aromaticivorans]